MITGHKIPETLDVRHDFFLCVWLLLLFETGFPCVAHDGFEISMSSGLKVRLTAVLHPSAGITSSP